jgi:hypothetical protein
MLTGNYSNASENISEHVYCIYLLNIFRELRVREREGGVIDHSRCISRCISAGIFKQSMGARNRVGE